MGRPTTITLPTRAVVEDRVTFADAALALAGHEVTDPVLRGLMGRVAANDITADEAVAAMRRHLQG